MAFRRSSLRPLPPILLGATLALACARGEAASARGRVVVDTLADGTPRTMTEIPVGWSDTNGWKLVEVARITGGAEGEGDLINPLSVAIDGAGNIYVSDQGPSALKKYGPDGSYLRTLAREGMGPGEFTVGFLALHGPHLYLHDPRQSRTSVFDTSGTFLRSWPSSCCFWANLLVDTAGHVGVTGSPPRAGQQGEKNPYSRMIRWFQADASVVDSTAVPADPTEQLWIVKQGEGAMFTDIPWTPRQTFALLPDHRIIVGTSDKYQIAVTRNNGADTTALFGRTWTPRPISDEARQGEIERRVANDKKYWDETLLRNTYKLSEIPTTAPAFDWIDADGAGDLWVRLPTPGDSSQALFDVFDPQYRWLGQVAGSPLLAKYRTRIIGDRIIGTGEDEEGNPVVVVYRIER